VAPPAALDLPDSFAHKLTEHEGESESHTTPQWRGLLQENLEQFARLAIDRLLRFADKTKSARLNLAGRSIDANEFFQLFKSGPRFWRREYARVHHARRSLQTIAADRDEVTDPPL
jgi:hypothetical protein